VEGGLWVEAVMLAQSGVPARRPWQAVGPARRQGQGVNRPLAERGRDEGGGERGWADGEGFKRRKWLQAEGMVL